MFRTVTVIAITEDFRTHTRSRTLSNPAGDLETIKRVSNDLMRIFLDGTDLSLRRAGVRVSGFSRRSGQKTLFEF